MMDKLVEYCKLCGSVGKESKLKVYQINLKEAIKLCEDEACNYPIGLDKVIKRRLEDVPAPPKRKNFNRRNSLHLPSFPSNQNFCLPRPQPLAISSKVPGNIIRPQPVSACPRPNSVMAPPACIKSPGGYPPLDRFMSPSYGLVPVTPDQKSTPSTNNMSSSSSFHPAHTISSHSNICFIDPAAEMDIDTSEVTEVIDIHFSTDEFTAFHGVTPKSLLAQLFNSSSGDNSAMKSSSDVHDSLQSETDLPVDTSSTCSESVSLSPFIPVRSNIGVTENAKMSREKSAGIKPMGSNNTADSVISQEIEIETSSERGSPILGEKETYFVIEGSGKRRSRKPKPKESKIKRKEEKAKQGQKSENEMKQKGEKSKLGQKTEIVKTKSEVEKDNKKPNTEKKIPSLDHYKYFPQWQNEEALCWLDVVLCLFVHSKTIKKVEVENENIDLSHTILVTLFTAYRQACQLINKNREKSMKDTLEGEGKHSRTRSGRLFSDHEESDSDAMTDSPCGEMLKEFCKFSLNSNSLKTGAGLSCSKDFMSVLSSNDQEDYKKAFTILRSIREEIWKRMQPRLQCVKGKNDSPVLAIPLVLKDSICCERQFLVEYDFVFSCQACGYQQTDRYKRVLPTFPSTDTHFTMREPSFLRSCFKCKAEDQRRIMKFNRLPEALMLHFSEGLPHNNLKKLQFTHHGLKYYVTGFVQYRNDPDHFVTWIHRVKDNKWMEFDDLKSPICKFEGKQPDVDPKQIHIVMWESYNHFEVDRGSSSHSDVFKNLQTLSSKSADSNVSTDIISKLTESNGEKCLDSASVISEIVKNDNISSKDSNFHKQIEGTGKDLKKDYLRLLSLESSTPVETDDSPVMNSNFKPACNSKKAYDNEKMDSDEKPHVRPSERVLISSSPNDVAREVTKVRTAKLKKKTQKKLEKEQPQHRSKQIFKDVLKIMSEKSNVIFTQKKEKMQQKSEIDPEDRRKALAQLWQPTPKVANKIMKAKAKLEEKTRPKAEDDENGWKPVNNAKLIEQKYREKSVNVEEKINSNVQSKSVGTEMDLHVRSKSVGTSVGTKKAKSKFYDDAASNGHVAKKTQVTSKTSLIKIPKQINTGTKFDQLPYKNFNNSVNNLGKVKNGIEDVRNKHLERETNGLSHSYSNGYYEPDIDNQWHDTNEKSSKVVHVNGSKYKILNAQTPVMAQVKDKFKPMQKTKTFNEKETLRHTNGNILDLVMQTKQNLTRCASVNLSSHTRKTFSGYRCKTFSSFPTSDSKCAAPSPTLSIKSEIANGSKRKLPVINNFIMVKKLKSQNATERRFRSFGAMNSTGNSIQSSPGTYTEIQNKETDILANLYNALDLPFNAQNPDSDSLDLSAIESSSHLQEMDDFLDQLL